MSNTQDSGGGYELSFAFDIDDSELVGLTPQEAFILGFEFSQVCEIVLDAEAGIDPHPPRPVHAKNSARIRKFARMHKIEVWLSPEQDGWRELRFV